MRLPLALLLSALGAAQALKRVVDLTPDNYDLLVGNGQDWMVEIYAPWCGHCKKLEPMYESAAATLSGNVNFGRVDGSKYRSLALRFSVAGFPTIFHVHGATGDVRRAAVQHSADALVTYARSGWKAAAYTPIPYWQSPNGPLKRAVFLGTKYGEKVVHLHEPIASYLGLPPTIVLFFFMLVGLVTFSGLLIAVAVWVGPGPDRQQQRPHAD